MSSSVRFTTLYPLDFPDDEWVNPERMAREGGVKIYDWEGLREALSDTMRKQMDWDTHVDRDEYPGEEWRYLYGFTSWGREDDEARYHNVANTDLHDLCRHWATVSEFTEPFFCYQGHWDGGFPHAVEIATGRGQPFYRVEADDGTVAAEEVTLGVDGREEVDLE